MLLISEYLSRNYLHNVGKSLSFFHKLTFFIVLLCFITSSSRKSFHAQRTQLLSYCVTDSYMLFIFSRQASCTSGDFIHEYIWPVLVLRRKVSFKK